MRQLSVYRRKPHLMDLLINKTPGAYYYRLKWASSFDSVAFTDFLTVPLVGFRDPTLSDAATVTLNTDHVRVIIDPSTYSIPDNGIWWLKMAPIDATGAEMFVTPPLMMYLPNPGGSYFPQFSITGSAPNAPNISGSIEINFPHQIRDMRILNSAAMWVAFDKSGQEVLLQGSSTPKDLNLWSTESVLMVRGNGAVVPFSLLFTLAYTR